MFPPAGTTTLAQSQRDEFGARGFEVPHRQAGILNAGQRATLRALAERSKLAHDLIMKFAERYAAFPAQLVTARTRELATIRVLLDRYRVADPTAHRSPGVFAGPGTRMDYRRLLARGSTGRAPALEVTARLASETIVLLQAALQGLTAADVRHTYLHLLTAADQQMRLAQAWTPR